MASAALGGRSSDAPECDERMNRQTSKPGRELRAMLGRLGPPLHFVTFHADLSADNEQAHPHTELAHKQYVELIQMMFASARHLHPGSRCTVLTTPQTDLSDLPDWIGRVPSEANADTLMRDRMAAQVSFLANDHFDLPIVLIDSDILVTRPLTEVFDLDFDVGLTWREIKTMPFNGGVIFLNNRRPEAVNKFVKSVFDIFGARHAHRSKWFGDQTAIAEYVGLLAEEILSNPKVEIEGVLVSFFPCEIYNYSPDNALAGVRDPLSAKAILHFKGDRKRFMAYYFDAYIGFRAHPSAKSLLRRFKARRVLRQAAPFALENEKDEDE